MLAFSLLGSPGASAAPPVHPGAKTGGAKTAATKTAATKTAATKTAATKTAATKTAPATGRFFLAELVARSFFRGLVDGRLAVVAPLCARRTSFDGRWVEGQAAQGRELRQLMQRARRNGLQLRGVWVVTQKEMVARFGAAPARLAAALRPDDLIALARFNRLGALAALRREGRFYRIHLLSD